MAAQTDDDIRRIARQVHRTEVTDVRAFGAVGDGVTDDTAAFQAVITEISAGAKRFAIIPSGTYLLNSNVTISGKVVVWYLYPGATLTGVGTLPGVVDDSVFRDKVLVRYASEILEANISSKILLLASCFL